MNQRELEKAIEREVEEWPEASVTFAEGGKHPKAKLTFGGKILNVIFPGTPGDSGRGLHNTLGDVRRALKKLGAVRSKPEPSAEEDEAPYRKKVEQPAKMDKVDRAPDFSAAVVGKPVAEPRKTAAEYDRDDLAERDGQAADQLRAEFQARIDGIVDGIYFGLPADVYHAVPRLSSSGIQKLCISPATFWRGSWLDPDRPDLDEEETIWQLLGRAYHTARLEPHLFESTYYRECVKGECPPGTLFTATDMSKQLEEYGLKKSGSVLEQAERLADAGFPSNQLWPLIRAQWEEGRQGRGVLPAKHYDQMIIDRDRITLNNEISPLLSGGEAEVSVFWTDKHGIQMKSRIDYLTRTHWADFKTFDNSRGKHLNQALADAVRFNRYYVQAAVYREAVEQIRVEGLQVVESSTDDQLALVTALQLSREELACWFVFQEKGGIPNLLAREFPFYAVPYTTILNDAGAKPEQVALAHEATRHRTDLFRKGEGEALAAKKNFVLYSEVYKDGTPWFPLNSVGRFHDEDFHPYWLSGDIE